jgi:hypothetical protein
MNVAASPDSRGDLQLSDEDALVLLISYERHIGGGIVNGRIPEAAKTVIRRNHAHRTYTPFA